MNEQILIDTINGLGDAIANLHIELAQARAQVNSLAKELNKQKEEGKKEVEANNEQRQV